MMHNKFKMLIITGGILATWFGMVGFNLNRMQIDISPTPSFPVDPNVMSPTPTLHPMSPNELINLINRARTSHRLPALSIDPILMQTAQTTADIMAGNLMMGHIGDVKGRVMAAGYGIGDIPWATENFVVLPLGSESRILTAWADDIHQIPMVDPNYKHVGAGVAEVDGSAYYVLHAAYTSNKIYKPGVPGTPGVQVKNVFSEYMYPVQTVTPQADGSVVHIVKSGQTLWSIAIAYNTHIVDILNANNLPQSLEMVYNGQRLIIPIPAVQQKTPEPTPTYTQMVVNTEIPVKKQITPSSTTSNATVPQNKPTLIGNMKTETDGAQSKQMIQYGIGSAIVLGLFLIIIGAITSKKKNQG